MSDGNLEHQVCTFLLSDPPMSREDLSRIRLLWADKPLVYSNKDSRPRIVQHLLQNLRLNIPSNQIPTYLGQILVQSKRCSFNSSDLIKEPPNSLLWDHVRTLVPSLPQLEAEIFEAYFFQHKLQTEIAKQFEISQPSVCYRLQRACVRMSFLAAFPKLDLKTLEADLATVFQDPVDLKVLVSIWQTLCQSSTAKQFGMSQGAVKYRFERSLKKLSQYQEFSHYTVWYQEIQRHWCITREVGPRNQNKHPVKMLDRRIK